MPNAIFRTNAARVENAANFVLRFREANASTDNRMYCLIGRETNPYGASAGSGLWDIESTPPVPLDVAATDSAFWDTVIGGQRVSALDIVLLVPKFAATYWAEGQTGKVETDFDIYNTNDAALGTKNFYCQNHLNEVFLCVKKGRNVGDTANVAPTIQPVFASVYANPATRPAIKVDDVGGSNYLVLGDKKQTVITGADGWVWKYLYTVHPNFIQRGLISQTNWLPVNFGVNVTQSNDVQQPASQSQDNIETANAGVFGQSYKILGARFVMIRSGLSAGAADGTTEVLPSNLNYRQVALVVNPKSTELVTSGVPADGFKRATFNVGYNPNSQSGSGLSTYRQFTKKTGDLIYIENRPPVYRVEDQTEEIRAIMSF